MTFRLIILHLTSILTTLSLLVFMASVVFFAPKEKSRLIVGGIAIALGFFALILSILSSILTLV